MIQKLKVFIRNTVIQRYKKIIRGNETKIFKEGGLTFKGEIFSTSRLHLLDLLNKSNLSKKELMIEVGSLCGFSTSIFADYFDKVISVDPYLGTSDKTDRNHNQKRLLIAKELFMIRFLDRTNVKQYNLKSLEASQLFNDNTFDFIYIDAGHDFDNAYKDINVWLPKLKENGVIAGDDYNMPGVSKAVNKFFGNDFYLTNNDEKNRGPIQWFHKKRTLN